MPKLEGSVDKRAANYKICKVELSQNTESPKGAPHLSPWHFVAHVRVLKDPRPAHYGVSCSLAPSIFVIPGLLR